MSRKDLDWSDVEADARRMMDQQESQEHVVLVAFEVTAGSRTEAEVRLTRALQSVLEKNGGPAESWWVAEDDRHDGSDNDSAIFVHPGSQWEAATILRKHGLTEQWNVIARRGGQFGDAR